METLDQCVCVCVTDGKQREERCCILVLALRAALNSALCLSHNPKRVLLEKMKKRIKKNSNVFGKGLKETSSIFYGDALKLTLIFYLNVLVFMPLPFQTSENNCMFVSKVANTLSLHYHTYLLPVHLASPTQFVHHYTHTRF